MRPSSAPVRIGIVAWNALPCIVPYESSSTKVSYGQTFGGMETAMWTLAQSLAKDASNDVTCFVAAPSHRNGNTPWPTKVNNVRLKTHVDRFRQLRHEVGECIDVEAKRLKRLSPNLLWQIPVLGITRPFRMRDPVDCQPDPQLANYPVDVWITFGVNSASSRVVATAASKNAPSFLCIQSNAGLEERLATKEEYRNECGESAESRRFALLQCDQVVAQSQWQLVRLKNLFRRDGLLARNPIKRSQWLPPYSTPALPPLDQPFDVLWIGRYDDFHKRPSLMLQAAKELPNVSIKMIANPFDATVESRIRNEAPSNVELIDRVPFEQMPSVFGAAKLFVSTGSLKHEGFPNVLLQSAASHTPIVSMSDHDEFLSRSGAGVACEESVDRLVAAIQQQLTTPSIDWVSVDAYLDQYHSVDNITRQFTQWIHDAIAGEA